MYLLILFYNLTVLPYNQFAPAMAVQNSYSAYVAIHPVSCPSSSGTQHPHGYAAILMAASVMENPAASLSETITVSHTIPSLAVEGNDKNVGFTVYPNPVQNVVSINYRSDKEQRTILYLYDNSGHLIMTHQFQLQKGMNHLTWNIASVTQGIYFIGSEQGNMHRLKIVKGN